MKEIKTIYHVRVDDIPLTKTRKTFLKKFLELRPATYYKNTNTQCDSNRNRSVSELVSIVRSRFSVTTIDSVIRILAELNRDGRCYLVWCTQVKKFVVVGGFSKDNLVRKHFVTNYSTKYYKNSTGVDGISYNHLMRIREEQLN